MPHEGFSNKLQKKKNNPTFGSTWTLAAALVYLDLNHSSLGKASQVHCSPKALT